jgi:Fic family protein
LDSSKVIIGKIELRYIADIEEFRGRWLSLSKILPERLESLKNVATIESAGSSTRIEGAKLTDEEVEKFLVQKRGFMDPNKSRDADEVKGYAEVMDMITESYGLIAITENHIKQIHQTCLRYSRKDEHHRGKYKSSSNKISAFDEGGNEIGVIMETAEPFETPEKMGVLIKWYNEEVERNEDHPLILIALFIVHFLAIHPFQDGNGRVSRALTTLLLLRAGYIHVQYSSLERVVEKTKHDYYLALRHSQSTIYTDHSKINEWVRYFLSIMHRQVKDLEMKMQEERSLEELPPLSKELIYIAKQTGKLTVKLAVEQTGVSRNTIKNHLFQMVDAGQLKKNGAGKGTWYQAT